MAHDRKLIVLVLAALSGQATASTLRDCASCTRMIVIPAGRFQMGSPPEERAAEAEPRAFADREGPVHAVVIARPFALAAKLVTVAQYRAFVQATHRADPPRCVAFDPAKQGWVPRDGYSWRHPGFAQGDDDPAVCLRWQDASDYAAWMAARTGRHYRLPSEAEWEYAARGGTTTRRYWGDSPDQVCQHANMLTTATVAAYGNPAVLRRSFACRSDRSFTVPVGSFPPNPFGLYDMYGGVWEWLQDCGHKTYDGAPADGSAWTGGQCETRVMRGGAYHATSWEIRSAVRGLAPADEADAAAGIRLARDLQPGER